MSELRALLIHPPHCSSRRQLLMFRHELDPHQSPHKYAPRERVSRVSGRARGVATWGVPDGMTSQVHAFEGREGGRFRISLTYDAPTAVGKSSAHTDTFHGCFVQLVPDERVVEAVELETADPALRGEMTITYALADADGGTDVLVVHDGLPRGVSNADNETGTRMSLANLRRWSRWARAHTTWLNLTRKSKWDQSERYRWNQHQERARAGGGGRIFLEPRHAVMAFQDRGVQ